VQVEPILQKINAMKPDLVVVSGDVTDDGYKSLDELKWAKDWLDARIEGEWFAVPGNHDVGNFVDLPEGRVTDERVARWNNVFGSQPTITLGHWIAIGFNSMPFGSELQARRDEIDRFASEGSQFSNKRLAVFLHSPLFIEKIDEEIDDAAMYWLGSPSGREATWDQFKQFDIKLIGTGHVHQSITPPNAVDGVKIAWAPPASGTWVHAPGLPNPPMPEQTGFFLHHLHDDGRVESELIACAPMLKCIEFNPWP